MAGANTQIVRMPDGTQVAFPSDMPREEIGALIQEKFPDAVKGKTAKPAATMSDAQAQQLSDRMKMQTAGPFGPIINAVGDYASSALSGVNEGISDIAGLSSFAANVAFNAGPAVVNAINPKANVPYVNVPDTGKMAKDAMTGMGMIKPPSDRPDQQFVRKIGEVVGSTVPLGGLDAIPAALSAGIAGATAQQVAPDNPWAEMAAEVAGGFTPATFKKLATTLATSKVAPTAEELQQLKNAAYKAADNLGVRYTGPAYQRMANDINATVSAANISPTRHPKAFSFVEDMQKRLTGSTPGANGLPAKTNGLSLTELDQLRQEARRDLLKSPDLSEQEFGRKIIKSIDDFTANATAADVTGASAKDADAAIKAARELNTKMVKTETIEDLIYRAKLRAAASGSGGNINNTLRQEVKNLLLDKSEISRFTPDEVKQMEDAVNQGTGENLLRLIGKLSPNGNGLMMTIQTGSAVASHGASIPLAILGAGAKKLADTTTLRKVNTLRANVARGSSGSALPSPAMTPRTGVALGLGIAANENANQNDNKRGVTLRQLRANALN